MTLRQLRQVASDLGVALYSRKSKEELVAAIEQRHDTQEPSLKAIEAEMAPAPRPEAETSVVFLPRDPQWAYVFWEIAEADRMAAQAAGATQLCLRVADVTGLPGGSAHPHTLQEVMVDSHATEWYLPVPLSDRDYRVELGYRKGNGGGWMSLAFSSVARVPALHPSEQILDQFVPFSLDAAPAPMPAPVEPVCTSACTRAPHPSGDASAAGLKPSTSSMLPDWTTVGSMPPAPASGRVVGIRESVASPPDSAPSGWWPMPS